MAAFRFPFYHAESPLDTTASSPLELLRNRRRGWPPSPHQSPVIQPPLSPGLDRESTPPTSIVNLAPENTPDMSVESSNTPLRYANILFVVNGGTPNHRGFKSWAHQLLLHRAGPGTPIVTRMIFFNQAFNQYVVQEITVEDGQLSSGVAEVGGYFSDILSMQQNADLIIIFSPRATVPLSPRLPLLKSVPHILIFVNERSIPSPMDAFAAGITFGG